ncbi:MAG: septal ring lytic transglycosylase RlpA family protein [Candidatus Omnitrophica bacterium]|nr:septal ring lytic transglycosylase RlpA family protein [Candidatus Omnitrophota bacterium]
MRRYWILIVFLIILAAFQAKPVKYHLSTGLATWYDPHHTSSGEIYQQGQLTCAMRSKGFGKYYLVCNLENNKCVEVRHNDFGPSLYLSLMGRKIDLSREAFKKIADLEKGVIRVRVGEVYPGKAEE